MGAWAAARHLSVSPALTDAARAAAGGAGRAKGTPPAAGLPDVGVVLDDGSIALGTIPLGAPDADAVGGRKAAVGAVRLQADLGAFFRDCLSSLKRRRRNARFEARFDPARPTVVLEGDSWALYPWKLQDIGDHLASRANVYSVGTFGDELGAMVTRRDYADAIQRLAARGRPTRALVFSGGGNDVLGPPFATLLRRRHEVPAGRDPARFVRTDCAREPSCLKAALTGLEKHFDRLFDDMAAACPGVAIYVHGYDYAEPGGHGEPQHALPFRTVFGYGDWLSKPLTAPDVGIDGEADQDGVIRVLVDAFNESLERVVARHARTGRPVHYVDTRDLIRGRWANEIHPSTAGFKDVAAMIASEAGL